MAPTCYHSSVPATTIRQPEDLIHDAKRRLRARGVNMDVPIAIGITLALAMSLFETATHADHDSFDAAIMLIAGLLVVHRITACRLGWIFRSLLQDEALAASVGVDVAKYRVIAFAICCAFGGIGGAFFTVSQQSIYPSSFGVPDSIFFMLYCFLGGLSSVFGPVVGAFVLFLSFELLAGLRQYQTLMYAAIMILTMLWLPNGLLSLRPALRLPRSRGEVLR